MSTVTQYPTSVQLNERELNRLTTLYRTAYSQVQAELEGATSFGVANRKRILAQIQTIIQEYGGEVNDLIEQQIEDAYKLGANQLIKQLDSQDAPLTNTAQFNQVHKDAIELLVRDTQNAFLESLQGVYRSTSKIVGDGTKAQITQQLATGKIQGSALRTIKANVVQSLKDDGLTALKDKGGRAWELDRYAEMLIRTKSVEARNAGLANRMVENGYDLVQVSAHGATDVCGDWEGKILSVSGETDGYPTVDEAEGDGLFHPNCRHAINALVPELAAETNAYNPNIDTITGDDFVDEVDSKFKTAYTPQDQIIGTKTPAR